VSIGPGIEISPFPLILWSQAGTSCVSPAIFPSSIMIFLSTIPWGKTTWESVIKVKCLSYEKICIF
jgi:hypothetical protein